MAVESGTPKSFLRISAKRSEIKSVQKKGNEKERRSFSLKHKMRSWIEGSSSRKSTRRNLSENKTHRREKDINRNCCHHQQQSESSVSEQSFHDLR
jgi:hypothetical protein